MMSHQGLRLTACLALLVSSGLAVRAANGLSTYAQTVAGQSQLGAAGPPLSCTVSGPTQQVRNAFTSIVMPAVGFPIDAGCGVGQNLNEAASVAGPITSGSALNSTFDIGAQLVTYNGSSQGRASYFNVGAMATTTYTGASNNMTHIGSEAFAISRETLTLPGPAGQPGTFRATITIDGSLSVNGPGEADLVFFFQKDSGPQFGYVVLHVDPRLGPPRVVVFNPAQGAPAFTTTTNSISGSTQFTFDVPAVFGAPFDLSIGLFASVHPAVTGTYTSNFISSAKLTGIAVLDAGGNPVPSFTIISGSGTVYGPSGIVPVSPPSTGTFTAVAGTGSGFSGFLEAPSAGAGNIAFIGLDGASQPGVYRTSPNALPVKIAGTSTPIPGGTGNFTAFSQVVRTGTETRFLGTGSGGQAGVYGCVALPGETCRPIVNLSTPVPRGTGTFTNFSRLAANGSTTSFIGGGSGQSGVYSCVAGPGDPCRAIADLTTAVPRGTGTFTAFSEVAVGTSTTSFIGSGGGQIGVYNCAAIPTDPCRPIADLTTTIPGGTGRFTGFNQLAMSGSIITFVGTGPGQAGVFWCDTAIPTDPCTPVADLRTAIPQGSGIFTGFGASSAAGGHVALFGQAGTGQTGIYVASVLKKLIASGDFLDSTRRVSALRMGSSAFDGETLTFGATFSDGSAGVFSTRIAPLSTVTPFENFQPAAAIDLRNNAFAVGGSLALAASSNGISPAAEIVRLQVGNWSVSIPAGGLRPNGVGGFQYRASNLIVTLQPLGGRKYAFGALGWNASSLAGTANPVTIELSIGSDAGTKPVTAFFGFVPH